MKLTTTLLISIFSANLAHAKGLYCKQNSEIKLECFVYTYTKTGKQVRFQQAQAQLEDLNPEQPTTSTCAARLSLVVSDGRMVNAEMDEGLNISVYEPTGYGYIYLAEQKMARGKALVIKDQSLNNGWSYTMTCEVN